MKWIVLLILIPFLSIAQPPMDRYQNPIFSVSETNDIEFSTAVPQPNPGGGFYEWTTGYPLNVDEFDTSPVDLKMDIFQPTGDTLTKRPLIIIAFGGGFLSGSKDHWSIRLLCQELAKRGFVTAAVDYRLGMNVFDSDLANRAVYRGLQDMRSAVRFFRADAAGANIYKIDSEKIFVGGHSSGAFSALHNAYLDTELERPLSTFQWMQDGEVVPDQGCLDCVGNNQSFSGHANAVFSLAGALGFVDFIDSPSDPTVVMFHSEDDGTVPYDSGGPFSSIIWLVVGSDLPDVYGSLPISIQADQVGLPYNFYSYTDRGHGVHEDGTSALYDDIIPGISDWFRLQELNGGHEEILGDANPCDFDSQQNYQIDMGQSYHFAWEVTGGTLSQATANSGTADVTWDVNATEHSLSVIPVSIWDAAHDEIILDVNIETSGTNNFLSNSNSWDDLSNWSQAHLPSKCEDVLFSNSSNPFDLSIAGNKSINSLTLGTNHLLTISANSALLIDQKNAAYQDFACSVNGQLIVIGALEVQSIVEGKTLELKESGTVQNSGEVVLGEE